MPGVSVGVTQGVSPPTSKVTVEIELGHHGGTDNGRLPVTYADFVEYGMDRHSIAPAIRELCSLGFVEITEPGRSGNAEWRKPNYFRLTYRDTNRAAPTHEWRRIQTVDEAHTTALRAKNTPPKNRTPVGKNSGLNGGNPHPASNSPVGEFHTTAKGE